MDLVIGVDLPKDLLDPDLVLLELDPHRHPTTLYCFSKPSYSFTVNVFVGRFISRA